MARLNEPTVSPGGLESLKRKFIRQNRDIARVNSTQSLRIRDLENDNSMLLSENLSLRETILRLQSNQEERKIQRIGEQTLRLKAQLESKLLEISSLVFDLGQEAPEPKISPKYDKITATNMILTPEERWRNVYTTDEAELSPGGRLPPIIEDTNSQRRTSGDQDLLNCLSSTELFSTESPEIESPPKSQFVDIDLIKINLPVRPEESEAQNPTSHDPILSVTVEQRKRRKDSLGSYDAKRSNHSITIFEMKKDIGTPSKGTKRKISARNEEETQEEAQEEKDGEKEVMTAKARENSLPNLEVKKSTMEAEIMMNNENEKEEKGSLDPTPRVQLSQDKQIQLERKALAPKNINASPRKRSLSMKEDKNKLAANMNQKLVKSKRRTRAKVIQIDSMTEPSKPILETTEIIHRPDLQSNLHQINTSNKCPSPLTSISSDVSFNTPNNSHPLTDNDPPQTEGSRPSRRVRGSVSYAEPNLRQKMRRPTQELADAVIKDRVDQVGRQSRNFEEVTEGQLIKNNDNCLDTNKNNVSNFPNFESCRGVEESVSTMTKDISLLTLDEKKNNHSAQSIITEVSYSTKTCPLASKSTSNRKRHDSESLRHTEDDESKIGKLESGHKLLEPDSNLKEVQSNNSGSFLELKPDTVPTAANLRSLSNRGRRSTLRGVSTNNSIDKSDPQKANITQNSKTMPSDNSSENRVGVSTRKSLMIR
ncbi:putative shugoshin c terminal domain-containing protein [Erysiphe neolycopersici]|uniref:Putative shugoshin c terminal domain-containing protein n=1 Tax=Erysiphe neolycopersici TaxID=212602 RepID=A0A420I2N8_9PEZI|nr:putative shugoshin c terminal domain-containing protein [Erysiphe neolycopersici]